MWKRKRAQQVRVGPLGLYDYTMTCRAARKPSCQLVFAGGHLVFGLCLRVHVALAGVVAQAACPASCCFRSS